LKGHGLAKDVREMPDAQVRASRRARLYMHAAARKRFDAERAKAYTGVEPKEHSA
jgi:hypothetical protein